MKTFTIDFTAAQVVLLDDLLPLGKESADIIQESTGISDDEYKQLFTKVQNASLDVKHS